MKTLRELQQAIQDFVLKADKGVEKELVVPENMPVLGQLEVYRNGYYTRLLAALHGDYPALLHLMGTDNFDRMARDYLDHYPSGNFSINDVGASLADFLQRTIGVDPYYVELAALEWSITRAQTAKDSLVYTLDALAAIPQKHWPTLVFTLHPSLNTLTFLFNTLEGWENTRKGEAVIEKSALAAAASVIVWRNEHEVHYRQLTHVEAELLSLLKSKLNFSDLCDSLAVRFQTAEHAVHWLAGVLQEWMNMGLFVSADYHSSEQQS